MTYTVRVYVKKKVGKIYLSDFVDSKKRFKILAGDSTKAIEMISR